MTRRYILSRYLSLSRGNLLWEDWGCVEFAVRGKNILKAEFPATNWLRVPADDAVDRQQIINLSLPSGNLYNITIEHGHRHSDFSN